MLKEELELKASKMKNEKTVIVYFYCDGYQVAAFYDKKKNYFSQIISKFETIRFSKEVEQVVNQIK